jgi:hypothetical protein
VVCASTAAAPLRCRFRLAQSSGCAWCVYRNHRPRLLVSATPNPTCDRFAGTAGQIGAPHYPVSLVFFLVGRRSSPRSRPIRSRRRSPARSAACITPRCGRSPGPKAIRLAHPRRRRHAHTDSQGLDPPNLAQASPATIPDSRRGERMRSCRRDCARARARSANHGRPVPITGFYSKHDFSSSEIGRR